jgi:pimeloyl-ACP methyl ester carboxylesterase
MTPLYFGTRTRRLFGVYTPAHGGSGTRAVVLCPPFGQEYLRAHRAMRQLGSMLATAGWHVLRFDYFGTGDSGADLPQADLAGWEDDIGSAIEELCDTSGATRVMLVGLRLGATLAARVAARRRQVDALIMWDPVVSGAHYVAELTDDTAPTQEFYEKPIPRPSEIGGGHEVVGFVLSAGMAREMAALDISPLVPALPVRTLAIVSNERSWQSIQALPARSDGARLAVERVDGEPTWLRAGEGPGALPVKLLQTIVHWAA